MPSPRTERSLLDLALRRMRELFQGTRSLRKLEMKLAAKRATVRPEIRNVASKCEVKACVFPAYAHGKCRGHLADAVAVASTLPSPIGFVVVPMHAHHATPHP